MTQILLLIENYFYAPNTHLIASFDLNFVLIDDCSLDILELGNQEDKSIVRIVAIRLESLRLLLLA